MRLLLIEEDTHRCAHIRQRLTAWRPQAQLVVHSPLSEGALVADFLAQGFDAVLLADQWPGGRGLHWARELAARAGFAPIVLLCEGRDDSLARELSALGAFSVSHEDLDREAFTQVLTAAERRQSHARAIWRSSQAGRETQRFGDAFIRGYRCIRRLAAGVTSDLYVGESERAGALVALKVARDRQDEDQPVDAFRRFLQEYEIAQRIASPAVVRLYDLGVSGISLMCTDDIDIESFLPIALARPQSTTSVSPNFPSMTLPGFRSRCSTPLLCAYSIASQTSTNRRKSPRNVR